MLPKLRTDVYYEPGSTATKVVVDGKVVWIKGRASFELLNRLSPVLNGESRLDDIVARLPDKQKQLVKSIIQTLFEIGAVRDRTKDLGDAAAPHIKQKYERTINYLESLAELPLTHFRSLRDAKLFVIGGGSALSPFVASLVESGVGWGRVYARPDDYMPLARLKVLIGNLTEGDTDIDWHLSELSPQLQDTLDSEVNDNTCELVEGLAGIDLVVGLGTTTYNLSLQRLCQEQRLGFLPVTYSKGFSTIGPLFKPETQSATACFECAAKQIAYSPSYNDTQSAWAFAGACSALEVFKILAKLDNKLEPDLKTRVIRVDAEDLAKTFHPVLPLGACTHCRSNGHPIALQDLDGLRDADASASDARPEADDLARLIEEVADPFSGILKRIDPIDLPQLPLALAQLELRTDSLARVCAGREHPEAGLHALQRGLESQLLERPGLEDGVQDSIWRYASGTFEPCEPLPQLNWQRNVGTNLHSWMAQGLLTWAERYCAHGQAATKLTTQALGELLDEQSAHWLKVLLLRFGVRLDVELYKVSPYKLWVATTTSVKGTPLRLAGRTKQEASRALIFNALAARQLGRYDSEKQMLRASSVLLSHPGSESWGDWLSRLHTGSSPLYLAFSGRYPYLYERGLKLGWIGVDSE